VEELKVRGMVINKIGVKKLSCLKLENCLVYDLSELLELGELEFSNSYLTCLQAVPETEENACPQNYSNIICFHEGQEVDYEKLDDMQRRNLVLLAKLNNDEKLVCIDDTQSGDKLLQAVAAEQENLQTRITTSIQPIQPPQPSQQQQPSMPQNQSSLFSLTSVVNQQTQQDGSRSNPSQNPESMNLS
jgi:hypothetical protein